MYKRNRIYISKEEQIMLQECKLFIAGAGLGSVISECALRMGIINIKIVDFDTVELTNLNRQNYTRNDVGKNKVIALRKRLLEINPEASIQTECIKLAPLNILDSIKGFDIAINTLDFDTEAPFLFDQYCKNQKMYIIHPFNLGWAGCAMVFSERTPDLKDYLGLGSIRPELAIVNHIIGQASKNHSIDWLQKALEEYGMEENEVPPPQLSVGSWLVAGLSANIMYEIAVKRNPKEFPEIYYSSIY